jgi:hypothetical protein
LACFAIRSRSSSPNGVVHTTGPKISSRATFMLGVVFSSTVGCTK